MSAFFIKKIETKIVMNYSDPEPSNLHSFKSLRMFKYQKDKLHQDSIMGNGLGWT